MKVAGVAGKVYAELIELVLERSAMVDSKQQLPEIGTALKSYLTTAEPHIIHSNPPLDLRTVASELQILPAMLDMGGCYALRPNGEVVAFGWDAPYSLRAELDERIHNMVYYQA